MAVVNPYSPEAARYYQALKAAPPPAPPPFQYNGLSATDIAGYAIQRRQAAERLAQTSATNRYQRGQYQAQQGQDFADLARKWNTTRENLPGTYLHRGLINSGIYGGALQQYGQQRVAATGALTTKYQGLLQGNDLQNRQAQDTYGGQMGDIASSEAARRADLASQIRNL